MDPSPAERAKRPHVPAAAAPPRSHAARWLRAPLRRDAGADLAAHAGAAEPAIAGRILGAILLVGILGEVERRRIDDLGRDRTIALGAQGLVVGGLAGLRRPALLGREHVDARAVLRPDVVALAHPLGRVMVLPERLQ